MEEDAPAVIPFDGKEPELADRTAGGQVGIQVFELLVEREGVPGSNGHHADHPITEEANDVRILMMELVDPSPEPVRSVLRNFLYEGLVVQSVDLREFPRLGCDFEPEWRTCVHCPLLFFRFAPMSGRRLIGDSLFFAPGEDDSFSAVQAPPPQSGPTPPRPYQEGGRFTAHSR